MPLHTLVIDFSKKKIQKSNIFFKSPCFIHGDLYFKGLLLKEKVTDDRNILGCESRDQVLQIYEKNQRLKISCYCPIEGWLKSGYNLFQNTSIKGTVSQKLRWVLLYINQ